MCIEEFHHFNDVIFPISFFLYTSYPIPHLISTLNDTTVRMTFEKRTEKSKQFLPLQKCVYRTYMILCQLDMGIFINFISVLNPKLWK